MTIKTWLRYPIDLHRARTALAQSNDSIVADEAMPTEHHVVFDLSTLNLTIDGGRHLEATARHLLSLGATCSVRCSRQVLAAIARKTYGLRFLELPQMTYREPDAELPENALVLIDIDPYRLAISPQHRTYWMKIGTHPERDFPVMPYPMHPSVIAQWPPESLDAIRQSADRGKILFAGNQKPRYANGKVSNNFQLCDRIEVLSTVTKHFARWIQRTLPANKNAIVLLDSRTHPIAAQDWLQTLGQFDFFLCCPGDSQPTCHHLVEAMSVGTIPIIEYGNRITPELTDGENAITFRGAKGLVAAIERIENLSLDEICRIRQNVIAFHDRYLCQRRFLGQWLDGQWDQVDVQSGHVQPISMPFHEQNLYSGLITAKAA